MGFQICAIGISYKISANCFVFRKKILRTHPQVVSLYVTGSEKRDLYSLVAPATPSCRNEASKNFISVMHHFFAQLFFHEDTSTSSGRATFDYQHCYLLMHRFSVTFCTLHNQHSNMSLIFPTVVINGGPGTMPLICSLSLQYCDRFYE